MSAPGEKHPRVVEYEQALEDARYALDCLSCPFYRKTQDGQCRTGCSSTPSCREDRPAGGWAAELARAVKVLDPDGGAS